MYTNKSNLKEWKLWFKITAAALVFIFILKFYIEGIVNIADETFVLNEKTYSVWGVYSFPIDQNSIIQPEIIGYNYLDYTINFFSFFTMQSNILIGIWFLIGAIKHNGEGKGIWLGKTMSLSVVTFITTTCIIFNSMLLPVKLSGSSMDANWWINQMVLHTIVPIMAIVYFVFFMKQDFKYSFKSFAKEDLWKMALYPIIYLIYSLIRGEMIYRQWGSDPLLAKYHQAYPYFFVEIHNKNALGGLSGIVWLLIAAIAILAIFIGLGSLYSYASDKINHKEQKKSINV